MRRLSGTMPILAILLVLPACGTDAGPDARETGGDAAAAARDQQARGRTLYERNCAQCHDAPEGVGSRLRARALAAYGTAAGLLDYNRDYMPYGGEGSLRPRQYLDITAYLLARHGFVDEGFVLTRDNASEVDLQAPTRNGTARDP